MLDINSADPLVALLTGPLLWFADWPGNASAVPRTGSAVYTVWDRAGAFIYVGMSGRTASATGSGPFGRLNSHASGRRSGDQFNLYICDRFVLPRAYNRIPEIAAGTVSLDKLTRDYIRAELGFRVVALASPADAYALERRLQRGGWEAGRPALNPVADASNPARATRCKPGMDA